MEAGVVLCHRGRVLVPAGMNKAWRTFCHHGTNLIEHYECRDTMLIDGQELVPVDEVGKWAHVQYRGTNCFGARNLSRCRIIITCRCVCPGARTITKLS
jgi:hypothetical protein